MPTPRKGETREHYLKRAIPMMRKEGLGEKAAVGKAEGMFDRVKGGTPHAAGHKTSSVRRITHAGEEEWMAYERHT